MLTTTVLLILSNVFMNAAWYGHLRHPEFKMVQAVLIAWGIAFVEYCFQVPANRTGYALGYSASELKTLQEVISIAVFTFFAWGYLGEAPRWNTLLGFALIAAGALCVYAPWATPTPPPMPPIPIPGP